MSTTKELVIDYPSSSVYLDAFHLVVNEVPDHLEVEGR